MSTFRVVMQNSLQGRLDIDPRTNLPFTVSLQRTMSVCGPNGALRQLADGETFTDCNYWKQFAYPQMTLDRAFIEVVDDDETIFSEVEDENVFPIVWLPGTASDGVIVHAKTYTDTNMSLDILTTYGGPALMVQIQNTDSGNPVNVKLNGSAVFILESSSTQIFNHGDLVVTSIAFDNSGSGATDVDFVQVILSVKSIPTS